MSACGTGRIAALYPSTFGDGSGGFIAADGGGYGFIHADDGEDLYFNVSGLQMSSVQFAYLKIGDRARFTAIDHPKGPRAIEVLIVDKRQSELPLSAEE